MGVMTISVSLIGFAITIGLVRNELGNRALASYLGSVIGVGFGFGYLTNYLAGQWNIDFLTQTQTTHAMINTPIATASAIVLAGLIVFASPGGLQCAGSWPGSELDRDWLHRMASLQVAPWSIAS